jgi:hypothetical protein
MKSFWSKHRVLYTPVALLSVCITVLLSIAYVYY